MKHLLLLSIVALSVADLQSLFSEELKHNGVEGQENGIAEIRGTTLLHFFLDPKIGSDANTGATTYTPWRTLPRCVTELQRLETQQQPYKVTFHLAPGTYTLQETFELSNIQNGEVTFLSTVPQGAVISGGYEVKGWKKVGIYQQTKLTNFTDDILFQMWVNGERRQAANTGEMMLSSVHQPYIHYKPGQINATWANDLSAIRALVWEHWTASWHVIEEIDTKMNTMKLKHLPTTNWFDKRYMIVNVKDKLAPGTFYYDHNTKILTYQPTKSDPPSLNSASVVIPNLVELMRLNNSKHMQFSGVTYSYTSADWASCLSNSCSGQSGSMLKTATLHTTYVQDITFDNCLITHTGGYAVWFDKGSQFTTIKKCNMTDLGAGGVRIGNAGGRVQQTNLPLNNTVIDNIITDGGHLFLEGTGVFAQTVQNIVIAHNEISQLYYSGVCMGWTWGFAPTSCANNYIGFNYIHHIGRGQLSDMGCIYTLGFHKDSRVTNNVCHDVWTRDYGAWGFYTDEGSRDLTWDYNIAYNTQTALLHQHYGTDNVFNNNVFAYDNGHPCYSHESCPKGAIRSSRARSGKDHYSSLHFRHNIVYIKNGTLFWGTIANAFANMTFDYNDYWDINEPPSKLTFPPVQAPESFKNWQKRGQDQHSILADPGFEDAAKYNFALKPDSPARKIGIKSIDTSTVGPRP